MKALKAFLLSIFTAIALAGCNEPRQFEGECTADSECPVGAACRGGLCVCRSDEACAEGEECNSQGICQKRAGCRNNSQCPDPQLTFCDIATGQCINKIVTENGGTQAGCGSSVHCEVGQVCDEVTSTCVPGCFDNADCPLFSVCSGASPGVRGTCATGTCADNSFCEFGQFCQNGACVDATDPNHCAECDNTRGSCGNTANFCLINPNWPEEGSQFFCGVDCEDDPATCPNGYACGLVRILTGDLCDRNMHQQCCAGGDPNNCCPDGEDICENRRFCSVSGEADARGACTCLTDEDCAVRPEAPPACLGSCGGFGLRACFDDSGCAATSCVLPPQGPGQCQWPQGRQCSNASDCDPLPLCVNAAPGQPSICVWSQDPLNPTTCNTPSDCLCIQPDGICFGSGRPCTTSADCAQLRCQGGGCIIGASCSPIDGVTCEDLRQ